MTRVPLAWPAFLRWAARHVFWGAVIAFAAVGVGTVGYRVFAELPWLDAFLNASMILAGMGPVDRLDTPAAKLFAALYALFSGLVFIAVMGVVLTPWAHRLAHRMHMDQE